MGAKLISMNFKPSTTLPEVEDLRTFLKTDFSRRVPGFTPLETNARWGDCTVDLLGRDASGALVAVFPSVSRQDRDFHEVISHGLLLTTWLEENKDDVGRLYGTKGVNPEKPLRMILVAPAGAGTSRALSRALERAGVEVMPYSMYDIETNEGVLKAVSFDAAGAPASSPATGDPGAATRPSTRASAVPVASAASAPDGLPPREPLARHPDPAPEPRALSPVETFISSLSDANLKAMSDQILTFLLSRFPSASGVVNAQQGFTLNVGKEHLATIRLDRTSLWLEVGPERIPTNKIKDPSTLDRAMNLPSVLEALHSVGSG
jgi:hypothetical protein